jgi:outer membrane receptor protein involved in Fe transport
VKPCNFIAELNQHNIGHGESLLFCWKKFQLSGRLASNQANPTSSESARSMKVNVIRLAIRPIAIAAVVSVSALIAPKIAAQATTAATAEVERVIVTGSNIPTAQEVGPNPVDTYRPADIEKLGIRNATDLLTNLPQEMGTTSTQNSLGGGNGTVIPNLRGLLPKETLVLIDGKRVIMASGVGVDINLIPFPMIDHIDILKDGASAVYGSDAVAGVINIFLLHKFRGLEIGGSIGNTNMGASNDARELEGWIKAGTGDDKTDILVIADFYDRAAIYCRDRDIESNAFGIPWGTNDFRKRFVPGRIDSPAGFPIGFRLIPKLFFSSTSPPPHSAPNVATSPFYVNPVVIAPNVYPGPPGIIGPRAAQYRPQTLGTYGYKGGGDYVFYNYLAATTDIPAADRQSFYGSFTRDICGKVLSGICRL